MEFWIGFVVGAAAVAGLWRFWPQIETEQRDLQMKAGKAVKDQVNKL